MKFKFDKKGFIAPPDTYDLSVEEFQMIFVDDFLDSETRLMLFNSYQIYTERMRKEITDTFTQWIGGSFTTQKRNPRDIDLVSFIQYETYEEKSQLLEEKFRKNTFREYGLDAYIVSHYPKGHQKYPLYQGNMLY